MKSKEIEIEYKPRSWKNKLNCLFCNENTGECLFNVNWDCWAFCQHRINFNPEKQIHTKVMFDELIERLNNG
jgi:hypothetical protein